MGRKETLNTSGLGLREKEIIEGFLAEIEGQYVNAHNYERAAEILDTFRGDLNRVIHDKTEEQLEMTLAELCLEEAQVPMEEDDTHDEWVRKIAIDELFEVLGKRLKAMSDN